MKIKSFKRFLTEIQNRGTSWKNLLTKKISHDTIESYFETYKEFESNMISNMINKKTQKFNLINPNDLIKIYNEHKDLGFVRSEKLLDNIIQQCIKNTIQIKVNNVLTGHEQDDPYELYKSYYEDSDNLMSEDEFYDIVDSYVDDRISDYGIKWAEEIVLRLMEANNDNEKIVLLNHLFDIIHQRSDFAEFYVIGGSSALSKISGTSYGVDTE